MVRAEWEGVMLAQLERKRYKGVMNSLTRLVGWCVLLWGVGFSVHLQAQEESAWSFSVGSRVWYAGWELEENESRLRLDGPERDPERKYTTDADPEPFISLYVDAEYEDWRFSLAYGWSSDYEFKTARTRDSLERKDIQFMVHRPFAEKFTAGLGLHRIENKGTTDGARDGIPARDFEYNFTGPEATLGFAQPVVQDGNRFLALTASGTFGYYMVDETTGFISELSDTAGFTWDLGVAAVLNKVHIKGGYRLTYINDSVWSVDQINLVGNNGNGGAAERRVVDANETFSGIYLELSHSF